MQRSSSLVSMSNGSKLNELPTWDPQTEASKKEVAQDSLAASLVHLIPVVIILCAILLWFFSYPETSTAGNLRLVIGKNASAGQ